jgi:hydroxypyruvate isomerase
MNRRGFLVGSGALALLGSGFGQRPAAASTGRLRQSVARWCFGDVPIDEFCAALRDMGITGMDLVGPGQ